MKLKTGALVVPAATYEILWETTSTVAARWTGKLLPGELGLVVGAVTNPTFQDDVVDVLVLTNRGQLGWCCGERLVTLKDKAR